MNWSIFAGLIAPLFCTGASFAYGTRFKTSTARPSSASTLAAQSGLLTALAILIPLAVAWSPWSRTSGWRWWFLFGAEGSGVFLMLATIYWMTEIQAVDSFELKTKPGLARCYNATWISLIFLAIAIVAPILDGAGETSPGSPEGAGRARFAVAHDLPELHADRQGIETAWGFPSTRPSGVSCTGPRRI